VIVEIGMLGDLYPIEWLINKLINPKIISTTIVLNSRKCNRSCLYCPIDNLAWDVTPVDVKEIESAFDFMFDSGKSPALLFAGGEPFYDTEVFDIFLHLCNKYKDKLKLVEILSNMDNWNAYKDAVNNLPNKKVIVIGTNRDCIQFESTDKIELFNKIFMDEIKFDYEYPTGKSYNYLFNLKIPSHWNTNTGDEFLECLNLPEIEKKIEWFYKKGCGVYVHSNITKSLKDEFTKKFYSDVNWYRQTINFPRGFKDQLILKPEVCEKCTKTCSEALPKNECPILHVECINCEYLPTCYPMGEEKFGFDKNKIKSCKTLKWTANLSEKYRKLMNL
jgi:hypothetical protein